MRLCQRIDIDAAVGTPMTAVKGYGDWPFGQQLVEIDHVSRVIRQNERRYRLASLWRRIAGPISAKPLN
jgi:hypothetical protein